VTTPTVHAPSSEPRRSLAGKRIILTRPREQAGDFEAHVRALGGVPLVAPAIAIVPPDTWTVTDAALRRAGTYDWIAFTSSNAVRALLERADAIGVSRDVIRRRRLAVVGPATAAVVSGAFRTPDVVASSHTAESLARELVDVENARVLLPRGDLAGDALPGSLRSRGAFVDEVVVYRTVPGDGLATIIDAVRAGSVDALLFASASAVRFVAVAIAADARCEYEDNAPDRTLTQPAAVCLGPVTAGEALTAGFANVVVADGATQTDLIDRVARWFGQRDGPAGESP
jgi:uroporphyrinogen-III synthase